MSSQQMTTRSQARKAGAPAHAMEGVVTSMANINPGLVGDQKRPVFNFATQADEMEYLAAILVKLMLCLKMVELEVKLGLDTDRPCAQTQHYVKALEEGDFSLDKSIQHLVRLLVNEDMRLDLASVREALNKDMVKTSEAYQFYWKELQNALVWYLPGTERQALLTADNLIYDMLEQIGKD